jgi:uncharacterized protein YqgC (DUF456 family)
MDYVWAILLLVVLLVGWVLTLFSMPGNWLMLLAAGVYAWLLPETSATDVTWPWLAALLVLALLGEGCELLAGALGVHQGGGSKRGAVLAVGGSLVGAVVGGFLGSWVMPVIGTMVGAVLIAAVGALGGAMLGEGWKGRTLGESWRVGQGAFWGRLLGTAAKLLVATTMVLVGGLATVL